MASSKKRSIFRPTHLPGPQPSKFRLPTSRLWIAEFQFIHPSPLSVHFTLWKFSTLSKFNMRICLYLPNGLEFPYRNFKL